MRRISIFAVAAVVLAGLSSTVAVAGGRGGTGHGATSSMHSAPLAAPKPGGSGAAAAVGPVGPPISSTLTPLPGNDRVTNCVHSSGMAGYSGTAQAGPFVHSCAFGQ
jgi:hypothetical protein